MPELAFERFIFISDYFDISGVPHSSRVTLGESGCAEVDGPKVILQSDVDVANEGDIISVISCLDEGSTCEGRLKYFLRIEPNGPEGIEGDFHYERGCDSGNLMVITKDTSQQGSNVKIRITGTKV